jgi:hypothetical protein
MTVAHFRASSSKTSSPSQGRYLYKQNKHRQTTMPWVGFEPTIPAFKRAKTVDICLLQVNSNVDTPSINNLQTEPIEISAPNIGVVSFDAIHIADIQAENQLHLCAGPHFSWFGGLSAIYLGTSDLLLFLSLCWSLSSLRPSRDDPWGASRGRELCFQYFLILIQHFCARYSRESIFIRCQ